MKNIKLPTQYRNTLLSDFIRRKLTDHPEPQRKNKKKGEPIGFTERKLSAALLIGLTNVLLKEIQDKEIQGKNKRFSYSTLRQWQSVDKRFKKMMDQLALEFAQELILDLKLIILEIKHKELFSTEKEFLSSGLSKKSVVILDEFKKLSDRERFSNRIFNQLLTLLFSEDRTYSLRSKDSDNWKQLLKTLLPHVRKIDEKFAEKAIESARKTYDDIPDKDKTPQVKKVGNYLSST